MTTDRDRLLNRDAEIKAWLDALNLAAAGVHGLMEGLLQRNCGWDATEAGEEGERLRDCMLTAANALRLAAAGPDAIHALANAVAQQAYNRLDEVEGSEAADAIYDAIYERVASEDEETPGFARAVAGELMVPATDDGRTIQ